MTTQELIESWKATESQLFGIFPGLKDLLIAYAEREQREKAVTAREQAMDQKELRAVALDTDNRAKEQRGAELDRMNASAEATVKKKLEVEEQRQRAELEARLQPLRSELESVEQKLREKKALLAHISA